MSLPRYSLSNYPKSAAAIACATVLHLFAPAQSQPTPTKIADELATRIDQSVREVLDHAQAPSASIAVVLNGRVAYLNAYGKARMAPDVPATIDTRYGIASVSKQFTAAAILLLAKDGKLKLEDPVRRYITKLGANDNVTIRQVLNHTSGYRDYWPQDYVPPFMLKPVSAEKILDQWVRVRPDFVAGSDWQYSNSNYIVAGQIVEKVSGQPLMQFLQDRIFTPLHMTGVDEDDTKPLESPDAAGYTRVALGPVRPALKEAPGWLYAAGHLAMPPRDLALWNISLIERSLLSPEGYDAMVTSNLGVFVKDDLGKRLIRHNGQISGMTTENRVWPEQRAAVSVMVNGDWGGIPAVIADRIGHIIFPPTGGDAGVQAFFVALQQGSVDPAKLTENAKSYFTPEALSDAAKGLAELGTVRILKHGPPRRADSSNVSGVLHPRSRTIDGLHGA